MNARIIILATVILGRLTLADSDRVERPVEVTCKGTGATVTVSADPKLHILEYQVETRSGTQQGALTNPKVSLFAFEDQVFHKQWFSIMGSTEKSVFVPEQTRCVYPSTRFPQPCRNVTVPAHYEKQIDKWFDLSLEEVKRGEFKFRMLDTKNLGLPQKTLEKGVSCEVVLD